jgi:hypothetical protein
VVQLQEQDTMYCLSLLPVYRLIQVLFPAYIKLQVFESISIYVQQYIQYNYFERFDVIYAVIANVFKKSPPCNEANGLQLKIIVLNLDMSQSIFLNEYIVVILLEKFQLHCWMPCSWISFYLINI